MAALLLTAFDSLEEKSGSPVQRTSIIDMLKLYRAKVEATQPCHKFNLGNEQIGHLIHKDDIGELLQTPGCNGLIAFFGIENDEQTIILMPVDKNGELLRNSNGEFFGTERWRQSSSLTKSMFDIINNPTLIDEMFPLPPLPAVPRTRPSLNGNSEKNDNTTLTNVIPA